MSSSSSYPLDVYGKVSIESGQPRNVKVGQPSLPLGCPVFNNGVQKYTQPAPPAGWWASGLAHLNPKK